MWQAAIPVDILRTAFCHDASDPEYSNMSRHWITVRAIAAVLGVVVAGVGCQGAGQEGPSDVVQIGSSRAGLFGMPAEYRALHPRLEEALGRPVRFLSQPGGLALGHQLDQGNIAFAFMSPREYAHVEDPAGLTLLASAKNSAGRTARKAYIIARVDYEIKTIADCKGRRFAFGTYQDVLTDLAARKALETGGLAIKELLPELLTPPPFAMEGRLYAGADAPRTIAFDPTVNVGVVDELQFDAMPETGGNLITGPSRDQFIKLGETDSVPEMVLVAGSAADEAVATRLAEWLISDSGSDAHVCKQMGISGFAKPDRAAYDHVRQWFAARDSNP